MRSEQMRKTMEMVEGLMHGDLDRKSLEHRGWRKSDASGRWIKDGSHFEIGADHLETVFVYSVNEPEEPIEDFETANAAINWIEKEDETHDVEDQYKRERDREPGQYDGQDPDSIPSSSFPPQDDINY